MTRNLRENYKWTCTHIEELDNEKLFCIQALWVEYFRAAKTGKQVERRFNQFMADLTNMYFHFEMIKREGAYKEVNEDNLNQFKKFIDVIINDFTYLFINISASSMEDCLYTNTLLFLNVKFFKINTSADMNFFNAEVKGLRDLIMEYKPGYAAFPD